MNIKNMLISVAIAALMISGVVFIFFKELIKENAIVSAPPAVSETAKKEAPPIYSIPANAVPSVAEIEKNIKAATAERAETDKMKADIDRESEAKREEIRAHLETAAAQGESVSVSTQANAAGPGRKIVTNPTREERAQMKAGGVIAY